MTDDEIVPINGGDTPEDSELGARIARLYSTTPSPTGDMAARCTEIVLQRVAAPAPDIAPRRFAGQPRHWVMAVAAIAAILLISLTARSGGHQGCRSRLEFRAKRDPHVGGQRFGHTVRTAPAERRVEGGGGGRLEWMGYDRDPHAEIAFQRRVVGQGDAVTGASCVRIHREWRALDC